MEETVFDGRKIQAENSKRGMLDNGWNGLVCGGDCPGRTVPITWQRQVENLPSICREPAKTLPTNIQYLNTKSLPRICQDPATALLRPCQTTCQQRERERVAKTHVDHCAFEHPDVSSVRTGRNTISKTKEHLHLYEFA